MFYVLNNTFIFSDNKSNPSYYSLHNSGVNHYHELYPVERYKENEKIITKLPLSSEHITFTDGDYWLLLHNYRQVITQLFISCEKSDQHVAYLHELFLMSCLCPMMKRPSSEEWCIAVGP